MNNDLISREALNIDELCRLRSDLKTGLVVGSTLRTQTQIDRFIKALDDVINNAPSVDIKDEIAGAYNEGYACGSREDKRPQGEWITRHKLNSFGQDVVCFECNKCGEYKVPLYHLLITEPLKVCPNCGADMWKGGVV